MVAFGVQAAAVSNMGVGSIKSLKITPVLPKVRTELCVKLTPIPAATKPKIVCWGMASWITLGLKPVC